MLHLLDSLTDGLERWLADQGQPGYRAKQIVTWIFDQRAGSVEGMSNLPKALRQNLESDFQLWTSEIVRLHQAGDGTEKLLLRWPDRHEIECVLLRDGERRTICISSQVGCAMGCVFCASGLNGVARNLTTGEIIEQMLRLQQLLPAGERISHIVVMGMGEPLANLDRLLPALQQASAVPGLGISPRRMTISTVGLPGSIDRLSDMQANYNLAVSLHAANDELRNRLVPVNAQIGIDPILTAADRYFEVSGRRLTYEYVLLAGVNDRREDAEQLAALLKTRSALLNVIPYNPVSGLPYRTPSQSSVRQFRGVLESAGVNVKIRQRKGDKINAACGQLRRIVGEDRSLHDISQPANNAATSESNE